MRPHTTVAEGLHTLVAGSWDDGVEEAEAFKLSMRQQALKLSMRQQALKLSMRQQALKLSLRQQALKLSMRQQAYKANLPTCCCSTKKWSADPSRPQVVQSAERSRPQASGASVLLPRSYCFVARFKESRA